MKHVCDVGGDGDGEGAHNIVRTLNKWRYGTCVTRTHTFSAVSVCDDVVNENHKGSRNQKGYVMRTEEKKNNIHCER